MHPLSLLPAVISPIPAGMSGGQSSHGQQIQLHTSTRVRALSQQQRYKSWSQPAGREGKAVPLCRSGKMSSKKELEHKGSSWRYSLSREADVLWAEPQLGAREEEPAQRGGRKDEVIAAPYKPYVKYHS